MTRIKITFSGGEVVRYDLDVLTGDFEPHWNFSETTLDMHQRQVYPHG